jgi:hypothetical protein
VGRVADVRVSENSVGQPAHGNRSAPVGELPEEWHPALYLGPRRAAVRRLGSRMRGHDVPEQHVFLDLELGEHAMHDRRGRFGRAGAGELALRGERDSRDAGTAVAGGFADEQQRRLLPLA